MSAHLQDRRLWLAGGAVAALLVVLLGWFLAIGPELSAGSSTRDTIESTRENNMALEAKNAQLKIQQDDAAALRAGLAAAMAELPDRSGLPEFTRQLSDQAIANSVVLTSVVVGAAVPVAEEPAPTASSTADAAATTTPTGLVAIPVTATAKGSCKGQVKFLKAIQEAGPRRALVTDVQLAPATGKAPCDLTVQLTIFAAPVTPAEQAALEALLSGN